MIQQTCIFRYFYQQELVLLTMVPRDSVGAGDVGTDVEIGVDTDVEIGVGTDVGVGAGVGVSVGVGVGVGADVCVGHWCWDWRWC